MFNCGCKHDVLFEATGVDRILDKDGFLDNAVDYDVEPTPLYRYLEAREWENVIETCKDDPYQAQIWVYRTEKDRVSNIRWKLLPLHAALIFKCPLDVCKAIINSYPKAAKHADDQGHLPLHLAFVNKAETEILSILFKAFPDAEDTKDNSGKIPCDYGGKRFSRYLGGGSSSGGSTNKQERKKNKKTNSGERRFGETIQPNKSQNEFSFLKPEESCLEYDKENNGKTVNMRSNQKKKTKALNETQLLQMQRMETLMGSGVGNALSKPTSPSGEVSSGDDETPACLPSSQEKPATLDEKSRTSGDAIPDLDDPNFDSDDDTYSVSSNGSHSTQSTRDFGTEVSETAHQIWSTVSHVLLEK